MLRRMGKNGILLILACTTVLAMLLMDLHKGVFTAVSSPNISWYSNLNTQRKDHRTRQDLPSKIIHRKSDTTKWIVVTSIQYPTEDVKNLASQSGWAVVVVADRKTPKDWDHPGVLFLSLEEQTSFGEFAEKLPFNSYTRKTIGYLYAMKHGAQWIYDTDDDNKPYATGLELFDYSTTVRGLRYTGSSKNISERIFNPYQFYGFKEMWPRGFPVEYLQEHSNGKDRMMLCRKMKTAAVQQGIVQNDPDVDAIYRLLHADKKGLQVTFNKFAPPIVLEEGTYSPWNSQNTLFHYRAFFTMFLPTTVAFRVTDIWRSYFAQKLLHVIGEQVAFYPVNAVQFRNAHSYLSDFDQEIDVYEKSGKIINFLDGWNCSHATSDGCAVELAKAFARNGFWKDEDYHLVVSWVEELRKMGYKFPTVATGAHAYRYSVPERFGNCRKANIDMGMERYDEHAIDDDASKVASRAVSNYLEIIDWCGHNSSTSELRLPLPSKVADLMSTGTFRDRQNNVLVLINNYPWKTSIGLLQRLYAPFFGMTVFCGTWNATNLLDGSPTCFNTKSGLTESLPLQEPINYIHMSEEEMDKGANYHYCFSKIRDLRLQSVTGYFFVSDDTVYNFWYDIPLDKVNLPLTIDYHSRTYWDEKFGRKMVELLGGKYKGDEETQKSWREMDTRLRNKQSNMTASEHMTNFTGKTCTDFHMDYFSNMIEVLVESGMFVENAMPKLLHTVDIDRGQGFISSWEADRGWKIGAYKDSHLGLHPVKMSTLDHDLAQRKVLCDIVVDRFVKEIFSL